MIMIAKRYHVSFLAKLLYREYSNPIIQQKRLVPVTEDCQLKENVDQILEGIDSVDGDVPKQSVVEHNKVSSSSSNKDVHGWDLNLSNHMILSLSPIQ